MGVRPDSYRDPPPALKNRRMSVFLFWSVTKIDRIAKTLPPHPPFILIMILILKIASEYAFVRIREKKFSRLRRSQFGFHTFIWYKFLIFLVNHLYS